MSSTDRVVNLITSGTTLLSGDLDECLGPDDDSCEKGIAILMAYARNYTAGEPTLVIQYFDKDSPFVNMHPLQWMVNRLIFNELFGLDVFMSTPSLLLQNKLDTEVSNRDISDLQTHDMPFLISNLDVNPTNSWFPYVRAIHFDHETGMALLNVVDSNVPLSSDQVEATKGLLNYIAKVNKENGCGAERTDFEQYVLETTVTLGGTLGLPGNSDSVPHESLGRCWIPVVMFSDVQVRYIEFLEEVTGHENPPALIVNLEFAYTMHEEPALYGDTNVWVAQCPMDDDVYCQHRITLSEETMPSVLSVEFIRDNLRTLPSELKDETYNTSIIELRKLADEAELNNPVVGYSDLMPVTRVDTYRACKSGECPFGTMFTDAIRWFSDSDVAFTSSGGYRGLGWPAGEVRLTDLYAGLPFPNTVCTGTMSGVSLFKLLNYSMSVATFEGADTSEGGRLMQVSGMQVTYNTLITGSRLISVDVYNEASETYEPLDRLKLYTFATDSYVCGGYDPYPDMTGGNLEVEGEVPGSIGSDLIQNVVADYLGQLEEPWDTSYQGRLKNETSNFEVMDFIQDEDSCPVNTVWSPESQTCFPCPNFEYVKFSDEILYFEADSSTDIINDGRVLLVNREPSGVSVLLKSKPRWVDFTKATLESGELGQLDFTAVPLQAGETLALDFDVAASSLVSGTDRTALGTVSFGVEDGGKYPGCSGLDATFDIQLRVTPPEDPNHLGGIFFLGVAFAATIAATAVGFVVWVYVHRETRVIKVMQPLFLVTICAGVFIMGMAIVPMGIDDGRASEQGCDAACMSLPWLLSTGFTLSFSALFSKLWRINKLFNANQGIRRIIVRQSDVLAPFVALFTLNFAILLALSLADPIEWQRFSIEGEDWNTFGKCVSGDVAKVMLGLLGAANLCAFLMACGQAYNARNISDEFSESKYIGIAIYGWFQILIIGVPILFLIDDGNPSARYVLQAGLIFIVCMSMMLILFAPAFMNLKKQKGSSKGVAVTGMDRSSLEMSLNPSTSGKTATGLPTVARSVQLGVMDSIMEKDEEAVDKAKSNRVSGTTQAKLLEAEARNRRKMIEQQVQLQDTSMVDNVEQMMAAMDRSSSSDDSDDSDDREHSRASNGVAATVNFASGEVETSDHDRVNMIERQVQLQDTSMAENVSRMMAAMQEDSSDDDSDD